MRAPALAGILGDGAAAVGHLLHPLGRPLQERRAFARPLEPAPRAVRQRRGAGRKGHRKVREIAARPSADVVVGAELFFVEGVFDFVYY